MDVRDAAEALILLSLYIVSPENESRIEEIYNLGIEGGYTMEEIGRAIEQKALKTGHSICIDKVNVDERSNSIMDSSKLYNTINWKPRYTLSDTVNWIWDE